LECTQEASAAKDEKKTQAEGTFRAKPSHDVEAEKEHETNAAHGKHPDAKEIEAMPGGAEEKVALSLRMTLKKSLESEDCDKLKGALAEAARVDASQVGMRICRCCVCVCALYMSVCIGMCLC
jgi:hypothetical protein